MATTQHTNTSGRRKTAVARVYLSEGTGKIMINDRELAK
jgi:small subunit ribosomal protein S9